MGVPSLGGGGGGPSLLRGFYSIGHTKGLPLLEITVWDSFSGMVTPAAVSLAADSTKTRVWKCGLMTLNLGSRATVLQ